jgi:hypothetical protein
MKLKYNETAEIKWNYRKMKLKMKWNLKWNWNWNRMEKPKVWCEW